MNTYKSWNGLKTMNGLNDSFTLSLIKLKVDNSFPFPLNINKQRLKKAKNAVVVTKCTCCIVFWVHTLKHVSSSVVSQDISPHFLKGSSLFVPFLLCYSSRFFSYLQRQQRQRELTQSDLQLAYYARLWTVGGSNINK